MHPIEFPEHTNIVAKDQPEYLPLPVHIAYNDRATPTTSCWQLTWRERFKVLFTGRFWFTQMTFGGNLQPQLPRVDSPLRRENNANTRMYQM